MRVTQSLLRSAQTRGGKPATVMGDRVRTWAEVLDRVMRLSSALRQAGLQQGDRVAILALNSDRYVEVMHAVIWAGGVVVPLNTRWAQAENEYAITDSGAKLLFFDATFAQQAGQFTQSMRTLKTVYMDDGPAPHGAAHCDELISTSEPGPDLGGSNNDLCAIFYTGGTTGHPKGVMLSHANFTFAAVIWIASLFFDEDTVFLHAAGLFHLAGSSPMFALTMAGGTHVFLPRFDPASAFAAIQRHRVNYCLFVPTMIGMLINDPAIDQYDLSSVRYCEYGGSPIPDAVLVTAMSKLPTWKFYQGYGLTETSALVTTLPWRYHVLDGPLAGVRKSAGRVIYGIEIRITDPAGEDVPQGQVGEIVVRGGTVMLGYWNKPEATAAAFTNGWFRTGDAAWMDDNGFVYVVDRVKDMIITGGENVYSGEVENALHQHPGVRECAVIAIPDDRWGEAVHAVVVARDGHALDEQQLIAHCRARIANYKCPKSVEIRTTPLPVSAAGKIQKALIRKAYWST